MLQRFKDAPIQRKLLLLIFLTSVIAMLLMCGTFFTYEFITFRKATLRQISTLGEVIANNSTAALAFQNQDDARETLSALKAESYVIAAALYDQDGKLFAVYPANFSSLELPRTPGATGYRFEPSRLAGFQPVVQRGKRLGTLYLEFETGTAMSEWVRFSLGIALIIAAIILLVTFALSRVLQRQISRPILALANTARAVAERHDYSVRAVKQDADEIGLLTESFNQMLTQIQEQTRALSESEARARAVLDSAISAVVVTDGRGTIIDWNARAETMFGWTRAEAIGLRLADTIIPPRYRAAHLRRLERYRTTDKDAFLQRTMEWSALRRDGSEFPVEWSISPIRSGDVVTFCGFITDITERKRVEEVRARLAAIVESSDDGIISKTLEGIITSWNSGAEKIFGYTAEEMIGQPMQRLIPPDRPMEEPGTLARLSRGESIDHFETERICKDGRRIAVAVTISPIKNSDGRFIGASKIVRDITERKQIEAEISQLNQSLEQRVAERTAELETTNRELEAFSYSVSHDLRAPLRHIDGFAGLLSKHSAPILDAEARRYLGTITGSAKRMGRLIDDLLGFSRMSRTAIRRASVDQNALIAAVVREGGYDQSSRSIAWEIASLPPVIADPALLRQVWVNLLENAVKYSGKNPRPRVTVGCQSSNGGSDERVFFVRDNGVGFDMAYADKLFGVFQRLHGPSEFEGTGIGLANVRRIVARHGGRTWAEGRVGEGAVFYFSLPINPPTS